MDANARGGSWSRGGGPAAGAGYYREGGCGEFGEGVGGAVVMKEIPEFENEDAEREFWATADSTEYLDWESGEGEELPFLKPLPK